MTTAQQRLIDIAVLMAQELQEFVDDAKDAVEGGYQEDPLTATQELLADWEEAYGACGLTEADHFKEYRGWHYPKDNDDLENMPAPGEIVVLFYEGEDGNPVGPVICTPIHAEGLHIVNGRNIYRRCIRWHEIPDEECPNAIAY